MKKKKKKKRRSWNSPKSCVPGTAAKVPPRTYTWKPWSSLFLIPSYLPPPTPPPPPPLHKSETSEPSWRRPWVPFVVVPWNKTNRIQVFWLALASCQPEVGTSEGATDGLCVWWWGWWWWGSFAWKWGRQVLRGRLPPPHIQPYLKRKKKVAKKFNCIVSPIVDRGGRTQQMTALLLFRLKTVHLLPLRERRSA